MDDNFMKWLMVNVPFYDTLENEEMNNLKEMYESLQKALLKEKNILDIALDHNKAGIDYGNDFEQAMTKRADIQAEIKKYVNSLTEVHNKNRESGEVKK